MPDSVTTLDFYGQYATPPEPVTPRCPASCTVNTYYDTDALACLACPSGTFTHGVGAVNCTAGAGGVATGTCNKQCDKIVADVEEIRSETNITLKFKLRHPDKV